MAGRTNFPPNKSVHFAAYDVDNAWEFMSFQLDYPLIFTVHNENPKYEYGTFIAQCGFSEVDRSKHCDTRSCKEGKFMNHDTTKGPYCYYNL